MPETPNNQPTFASVLEQLMASRGVNQAALARALGIWDANIGRWRRGAGIDIENVRKLADFFNVDREYLERLAGYGDKQLASAIDTDNVDAVRQFWRGWYDELLEKEVPRPLWNAYTTACQALAESFRDSWNASRDAHSDGQDKRIRAQRARDEADNPGDEDAPNTSLSTLALALANR